MSRRNKNNQNNQYNNPYYGNGQYYNGYGNNQYYNQNGQYYNQNGQYYNQNGQYYNQNNMQMQNQYANGKFGINNSNNQKSKKAKPKKDLLIKIGLFAGFAIILVVAVLLINSCNKKEEKKEEVPVSYSDTDKQVGNATLGYVTVPTEWLNFQDISSDRGLRYADKDGTYIVTLDALSTSTISAKDYALGIANNLEQSGVTNLKGAEVKLAGYDAYQIYGYHPTENVWLLIYFFEAEDGNTHYIGVEGPERTDDAFKIPDTFSLTEKSE